MAELRVAQLQQNSLITIYSGASAQLRHYPIHHAPNLIPLGRMSKL
jgi:hypothetical protein